MTAPPDTPPHIVDQMLKNLAPHAPALIAQWRAKQEAQPPPPPPGPPTSAHFDLDRLVECEVQPWHQHDCMLKFGAACDCTPIMQVFISPDTPAHVVGKIRDLVSDHAPEILERSRALHDAQTAPTDKPPERGH